MMTKKRVGTGIILIGLTSLFVLLGSLGRTSDLNGSVHTNSAEFTIKTQSLEYVAGDTILLGIQHNASTKAKRDNALNLSLQLMVISSFGITVVDPINEDLERAFTIPNEFCKIAGDLQVILLHRGEISDRLTIQIKPAYNSALQMENYIGPPSIIIGSNEYAMLVSLPTDAFDNLLSDNTELQIHSSFGNQKQSETKLLENGYAWKKFYPNDTPGKLFVGVDCLGVGSGQLETVIQPSKPTDFNISVEREHNYADGNELVTLRSSVLKDQFGNTLSDGTLVVYEIQSDREVGLSTSAVTINGIATAQILHPDLPSNWEIQAVVPGISQSDLVSLEFEAAIRSEDLKVTIDEGVIIVGPIYSYLGQLVPDGTEVTLQRDGVKMIRKYTQNGAVEFDLNNLTIDPPNGMFIVEAMGMNKTVQL